VKYSAEEMGEVRVKVYNAKGRLIRQQTEFAITGQQAFSIDISSLQRGSYFVELDNGKGRGIATFIVHYSD